MRLTESYLLTKNFNLNIIDIPYTRQVLKKSTGIRRYYDTFDGRITAAGLELIHFNADIILRDKKHRIAGRMTNNKMPVFVTDMPAGKLREKLAKIIDVRAILYITETACHKTEVAYLNRTGKCMLKFVLERLWYDNNQPAEIIGTVIGLAGYRKAYQSINKWFKHHKFNSFKYPDLTEILKHQGNERVAYPAKLVFHFQPDTLPVAAIKEIFTELTGRMQANEEGIIKNIDTEFLHDYRVTVRRIRTAINQFKILLKPDMFEWAKRAFSKNNRLTNRLRDLDVLLQKESYYKSLLPARYQAHLSPFFNAAIDLRKREHGKVVTFIQSPVYKELMDTWKRYIHALDLVHLSGTMRTYVNQWLKKRVNRVRKLAGQPGQTVSEEQMHRLRIECKKLRYLLEFFMSLYPKGLVKPIFKQLKYLQDCLGRYNDYCVQKETLRAFYQRVTGEGRHTFQSLLNRLDQEQEKEYMRCQKVVAEFCAANYATHLSKEVNK